MTTHYFETFLDQKLDRIRTRIEEFSVLNPQRYVVLFLLTDLRGSRFLELADVRYVTTHPGTHIHTQRHKHTKGNTHTQRNTETQTQIHTHTNTHTHTFSHSARYFGTTDIIHSFFIRTSKFRSRLDVLNILRI